MGKNDFLTPKAIGNRIKSKGLQKLRWYCQMCQKQCRDENGFKCHLTSESHKRQMMVFGQNPDRVVEGYTEEFLSSFMEHLRRAHPNTRIAAKVVYNEYIADKHHVHMNSTSWLTLTDFVKYLGREGLCRVDETPKGWFISLIQKDPMEELDSERRVKRDRAEKEEEERHAQALEAQIERARKLARVGEAAPDEGAAQDAAEAHELQRDEGQHLAFGLPPSSRLAPAQPKLPPSRFKPAFTEADSAQGQRGGEAGPSGRGKSKMEELMEREQRAKLAKLQREPVRKDNWIKPNIIVKVMSKELKEHGYYKKKGVIKRLVSPFVAEIGMLDSGDLLQVDQAQLETVIPQPGGTVLVLNGIYRGSKAKLLDVNTDKYQAQVSITGGQFNGKEAWLEYEDLCKLQS